jgi:hypothetical protein
MEAAFGLIYLLLLIAIWASLVWICRNMALRRNRSGWFGGFLGFFLGVFGVLILWGIGDKTPPARELRDAHDVMNLR